MQSGLLNYTNTKFKIKCPKWLHALVYICRYIYMCVCVYMYIAIDAQRGRQDIAWCICVHVRDERHGEIIRLVIRLSKTAGFDYIMNHHLQLAALNTTSSPAAPLAPLCNVDGGSAGWPPNRRRANIGRPSV